LRLAQASPAVMAANHTETAMVSFCIVTHNQEAFVREAIEAALRQNYSDIEFIISDDCSTDCTFEVIQSTLRKKNTAAPVKLLKNPANLGIGGNINRVMEVAKGSIIVIAAGDDISHPDRTRCLVEAFDKYRERVHSVYSDHTVFLTLNDADREQYFARHYDGRDVEYLGGDLSNFVMNVRPLVTGATHAWHRDVFEKFGPLGPKTVFEDMAISFRSLSMGGIGHIKQPLVLYRRHETNVCSNFLDPPHKTMEALKKVKIKELNCIRGYLVGYKYMKRDLKFVTGMEDEQRRRLNTLINKYILRYRTQIRLRNGADEKRAGLVIKYFRMTGNFRATAKLVKLLIPGCLMDRMRVLKQILKHR
jgi:glycosyltransferase involved in cell wall biosynthesis